MVWRSVQFCHDSRIDTVLQDFHKTKFLFWVSDSFSVFLQKLLERAFRIPRAQWSLSQQAWSPAMFRVDTHKPLSGWEANVSAAQLDSNCQTANLQRNPKILTDYKYIFNISPIFVSYSDHQEQARDHTHTLGCLDTHPVKLPLRPHSRFMRHLIYPDWFW